MCYVLCFARLYVDDASFPECRSVSGWSVVCAGLLFVSLGLIEALHLWFQCVFVIPFIFFACSSVAGEKVEVRISLVQAFFSFNCKSHAFSTTNKNIHDQYCIHCLVFEQDTNFCSVASFTFDSNKKPLSVKPAFDPLCYMLERMENGSITSVVRALFGRTSYWFVDHLLIVDHFFDWWERLCGKQICSSWCLSSTKYSASPPKPRSHIQPVLLFHLHCGTQCVAKHPRRPWSCLFPRTSAWPCCWSRLGSWWKVWKWHPHCCQARFRVCLLVWASWCRLQMWQQPCCGHFFVRTKRNTFLQSAWTTKVASFNVAKLFCDNEVVSILGFVASVFTLGLLDLMWYILLDLLRLLCFSCKEYVFYICLYDVFAEVRE